jgi:SAM-dependent methyltransferase
MTVFNNYAQYYDLLYQDKDYVGEANFIHRLLETHAPNAKNILDLGCGTGIHAALLAEKDYQVHGVDFSQEMLERGYERIAKSPQDITSRLQLSHGDIRQVRLNKTFDVVLSLFHVISYQTTNEDLQAAFTTAKEHLKPGGLFIFDIWYGPAVLTDPPTVRIKRLEDEKILVTRIAEPVIYPNKNCVDVNYQVFIQNKQNHLFEELKETHRMRYLFQPEIELLLQKLGMKTESPRQWLQDREAGLDTWSVYFLARN